METAARAAAGAILFIVPLSLSAGAAHAQQGAPAPTSSATPTDAAGYVARAAELAAKGQADAAIADYTAALKLDAKNLAALKGRGDLYLAAKRYNEARADYGAAIELDRDNRTRYQDRGWANYSAGEYQTAMDDFNEILRIDKNDVAGHRLRAMAYEAMAEGYVAGTPDRNRLLNQALRDYDAAVRVNAKDAELLARRAGLYNKLKNYAKAVDDSTAAIALDADHAPAYSARGDANYALSEFAKAIADYDRAIKLDASSAPYLESRAIAHRDSGNWDAAFADYTAAIDLDKKNPLRYNARANAYFTHGEYDRAIADYNQCLILNDAEAQYYENRANANRNAGHWDEALKDFAKAIEHDNKNGARYNARGDAYFFKEEYAQSIVDYEEAIRLDPTNSLYFENEAIALRRMGRRGEAIKLYGEAVTLAQNNSAKNPAAADLVKIAAARFVGRGDAYKAWGDTSQSLADYEQAITDYTKAIELNKTGSYYISRANVLVAARRFDPALADYNQAVALEPKVQTHYVARGNFYRSQERYKEAIADLDQAIALNGADDTALNLRAICYEGVGDDSKAIDDYTAALNVKPTDSVIRGNRATVYVRLREYDLARADADAAIAADPNTARNYNTLGDAYYFTLKYAEAEKCYGDALERDATIALYWDNRAYTRRLRAEAAAGTPEAAALWEGCFADFTHEIEMSAGDPTRVASRTGFRADSYFSKGDYEKAAADYSEALKLDPENSAFYQSRGVSYRYLSRWVEAFKDLDHAIDLNPKVARHRLARAHAYYSQSKYPEAIADYSEAIAIEPDVSANYEFRANAYRFAGKWDEAYADFDKALLKSPKNGSHFNARAGAHYAQGDYEKAIADYTSAIECAPNVAQYVENRATAYRMAGDWEKSLADCDRAVEMEPGNPEWLSGRGDYYYFKGDYPRAEAEYTAAIALNDKVGTYWDSRGVTRRVLHKTDDALADFAKAIELEPENAGHYNARGDVYYFENRFAEALEDYDRAVQRDGTKSMYIVNRAIARRLAGKPDDAWADYNRAIEMDPSAINYNYRANAYQGLKQYEESLKDYNKAIELSPKEAVFYENRGNSYRYLTRWDEAFADYNKAVELEPKNAARYNARGDGYFFKPDYEKAEAEYTQAIAIDPKVALYWENRAITRRLLRDTENAFKDFDEGIRLDPDNAARYNTRGEAYYWESDYAKAVESYTQAIERDDSKAQYYVNRALSRRLAGAPVEEWLSDNNRAIELEPKIASHYNARADGYYAIQEYQKAIDDFTAAFDLGLKSAARYNNRANAYYSLKKYDEATADYTSAIELDPKEPRYVVNQADARRLSGNFKEALEKYNAAIKLAPTNADNYNSRGDAYFYDEQYDKAIEDYSRAILLDEKNPLYWENRGHTYRGLKKWDKAYADFEKSIGLDSKNPVRYSSRAYCYQVQGDYENAIADYTRAITLAPKTIGYYESRGAVYRLAGQWDEALADYGAAIGLDSENAARYNARGDVYYYREEARASKNYDDAIADYTKAIQYDGDNALYYENRGIAQRLAGKATAALRDFDQAIKLESEGASHFAHRGHVYFELNDFAKAAADYSQAIGISPLAMYLQYRGAAYRELGRWDDAFKDYDEAIAKDQDNAERYNARGYAHHKRGEYDAAVVDYDKAIELDSKTKLYVDNRSCSRRDQHWIIATRLRSEGKFDEALAHAVDMLAIEREWLGADHKEVANSIEWIASVCQDAALAQLPAVAAADGTTIAGAAAEYLARSEERYAEAVAWREQHNGQSDWQTVNARIALIDVQLLRKMTVAQIRKYVQWNKAQAEAAQLYEEAHYGESLRAAQGALQLCRATVGESNARYAASLASIAQAHRALGEDAQARPLFQQALDLRLKVYGERHPVYCASLDDMAELLMSLNDAREAARMYELAAARRKDVMGETLEYALTLSKSAAAYVAIGDFFGAETKYLRAKDIIATPAVKGPKSAEYASVLEELATLYELMEEHHADVEKDFQEALDIRSKVQGADHPDYAYTLYGLAGWYERSGKYKEAGLPLQQALSIVFNHVEKNAYTLTERQQITYQHKLQIYLDSFVRCLLRADEGDETAYRQVLAWKGSTLVRQRAQSLAAGSPEIERLRSELRTLVPRWASTQTMIAQAASEAEIKKWQAQFEELTRTKESLELQLNEKINAERVAEAERKAGEGAPEAVASGPATLESLVATLPADGALVDYLEFTNVAPSAVDPTQMIAERRLAAFVVRPGREAGHAVEMFELGPVEPISKAIDLWRQNFGMGVSFAAGQTLKDAVWKPLEASLAGAATVLISPDGSLGRFPFAALPGKAKDTYLIEDLQLVLVPVPQLISELMTAKVSAKLDKELLVMGGVDYDHRSSGDMAAAPADEPEPLRPWERNSDTVAMRSVISGGKLPFLAASEGEATFIRDIYQRTMHLKAGTERIALMSGPTATEEEFRRLAPQCYMMHLATHGFFAAEDKKSSRAAAGESEGGSTRMADAEVLGFSPGLLSGLVLAGANNPPVLPDDPTKMDQMPDDGFLTADEIAVLPLGSAQLVVLSACESGLGETAGGEGLLGIQRAFQVAGARSTIASIWKVPDGATRAIMEQFYRNVLEKHMPTAEALRAAQRWAIDNPDIRGGNAPGDATVIRRLPPQYWAAFSVSGAWK